MSEAATAPIHPDRGRFAAIDNLRSTLTLLVVAHHAVLAYVSYAPLPFTGWGDPPMVWRAFPVVDTVRAQALDLLVGFNDAFLMSLFFLLAGLFTWQGLSGKGALGYFKGRARRLGLPFLFGAAVLAPLAYYPAYIQHDGQPGIGPYLSAWLDLPVWPSGPVWFLWVLLAFSGLAALGCRVAPRWGVRWGERLGWVARRPSVLFGALLAVTAAVYLAVTAFVDPLDWFEIGPFTVQTSRILHYAIYFALGIGLGAVRDRGLFAQDGKLARRWALWGGVAFAAFVAFMTCVVLFLAGLEAGAPNRTLLRAVHFGFALSCAASSFMGLSFFLRFGGWTGVLWRSLARNAFGIYVLHYVFVTWTQWAVLDAPLSAGTKATLVLFAAVLLSWGTTAAWRRVVRAVPVPAVPAREQVLRHSPR